MKALFEMRFGPTGVSSRESCYDWSIGLELINAGGRALTVQIQGKEDRRAIWASLSSAKASSLRAVRSRVGISRLLRFQSLHWISLRQKKKFLPSC